MAAASRDDLTPLTPLLPLDEWKECRSAIGRLDGTLAGFRQFSFSLVTILITASAFFGGVPKDGTPLGDAPKAAVVAVLLTLVTALFFVDRYYCLIQSAAAERALNIERELHHRQEPQYLSEVISSNATHARAPFVAVLLYWALGTALVGLGLGLFGLDKSTVAFHNFLARLTEAVGRAPAATASDDWWRWLVFLFFYVVSMAGLVVASGFIGAGRPHGRPQKFGLLLGILLLFSIETEALLWVIFGLGDGSLWFHILLYGAVFGACWAVLGGRFWSALSYPRHLNVSALWYRVGGAVRPFAARLELDVCEVEPDGRDLRVTPLIEVTDPGELPPLLRSELHEKLGSELPRPKVEYRWGPSRWQTLASFATLYAILPLLALLAYAAILTLHAPTPRSATITFLAGSLALVSIFGAFAFTEMQAGTGWTRARDYFLRASEGQGEAIQLQLKARTTIRAVWAFTRYEFNRRYLEQTLRSAETRKVRTVRVIDLANLPVSDVKDHIVEHKKYLCGLYQVRLCANIAYEMLIVDNLGAVIFGRTEEDDERWWIQHSDPLHVNFVQDRFTSLLAESVLLPLNIINGSPEDCEAWLEKTREDLLRSATARAARAAQTT